MLAVLHLPRKCTGLRDILLIFTLDAFSPFGYPKRAFNDLYLRGYLNSTVCLMRWGSGTGTSLFTDSLGNLDKRSEERRVGKEC